MIPGVLVLSAIVLSIAALLGWRYLVGARRPGYLALTEYWVYTGAENLPEQTALMDRMVGANPHNRRGFACVGAREGMIFSDIRLHMGLARRSKNPTSFRPDLFESLAAPTKEVLEGLAASSSLIRVRYASQAVLTDTRQLQFMPHLADAVAELTGGTVVFDQVMERLWTAEEFHAALNEKPNCERPDFHVQVAWQEQEDGFYLQTRGLRKVGWPELLSGPHDQDHEVLMRGLMTRLAFHIVRRPAETGPFEFDEFDDTFVAEVGGWHEGKKQLTWIRRQVKG
ncbi:MAG: hypothetical protein JSS65_00875 [Armatimonadetes bacterium]|nr:hypothetical protein [Armatimonadota bacterium]